jgi:Flp pilus assembly protein TadD
VYGQVLWHVAADASGATEQLRKAIELDPLASLNWSRLGQVQVHLDEREPARMALRRAFDLDGKNENAIWGLAKLELFSGHPEEARRWFDRSANDSAQTWVAANEVSKRLGQTAEVMTSSADR